MRITRREGRVNEGGRKGKGRYRDGREKKEGKEGKECVAIKKSNVKIKK